MGDYQQSRTTIPQNHSVFQELFDSFAEDIVPLDKTAEVAYQNQVIQGPFTSVITTDSLTTAEPNDLLEMDIYPIGLQPNETPIEPKIDVNPVLVPEDSNLATPYINIQLPDSTGNLQNYVLVPAKTEPSAVTMNNHTTETKNKKRFRHLYNSVQLSTLENEFRSSKCISRERKMQLAQELNITPKQIKTWFQNRRTKSRKQLSLNNTSSPGTLTSRSSSSSGPSPCSVTDEETDVTLHLDSMGHNCYKVEIENPQIQKGTDILSKSQSKGPQVTSRSTGLQEKEVLPSCAYHYSPNDAFHGRFDVYGIQDFQRSIPSKANHQFIGQLSQQRAWQDPNFEQPPRPFNQFRFSQRIPSNKIIPSHGHIEYSANQMRSQYSADFANSIYDKNYSAPQSMFLPQMQLTGNMYSMPVRDYPYCPETVWPMAQARVKNEDICGTIQQI